MRYACRSPLPLLRARAALPAGGLGVALFVIDLMPVRISRRTAAGVVEQRDMRRVERPSDRAEILAELLLVARADHDIGDGWPRQQPGERDLADALAGVGGDLVERIDHGEQIIFVHRRAALCAALGDAPLAGRLAAADLAGQAAPAERAPHHQPDTLIDPERHQFMFVITPDQRIITLIGDVAGETIFVRLGEALHEVPAGEIGRADIADLARADQVVERAQRLFDRRQRIEAVHEIQVDMIGLEPLEACLDRADQMETRRTGIVGPGALAEAGLGRDQGLVALALERRTQNLLRRTFRIDVGGVEQGDARIEADVDQPAGLIDIGRAPSLEEGIGAAERAGAEAQCGDLEAGAAELAIVHGYVRLAMRVERQIASNSTPSSNQDGRMSQMREICTAARSTYRTPGSAIAATIQCEPYMFGSADAAICGRGMVMPASAAS